MKSLPKRAKNSFNNKWKIALLIFIFSLTLRIWDFNGMGRTWDEMPNIGFGYKYIQLLSKGDFSNPFWYQQSDHPPLSRYIYGLASTLDIEKFDKDGKPIYFYDYTFARFTSTLLSSLTAIFVFLLGLRFFGRFVGISSALIFAAIPFFIGFSHATTQEAPLIFTYTASIFFFINYLDYQKRKTLFLTGIFIGLAMLTKYTNILSVISIFIIYIAWMKYTIKKILPRKLILDLLILLLVSLTTIFILWPMIFLHPLEFIHVQQDLRFSTNLSIPERFFGRLMLVPIFYYPIMFLITTPVVLIVLSLLGMLKIDRKRTWIGFVIIIWFIIPFAQSFHHMRQHGVRYIIEIYAPFSLLCGIGLSYISTWFGKKQYIKYILLSFVLIYLFIIFIKISPYYLDYFNETVGGNNHVYNKQLFQMGWWGQGIGEAVKYINMIEKRNVTIAVDGSQPESVMPEFKKIKVEYYTKNTKADYVLVPYFNVVRLWFPEYELQGHYKEIHAVMVDKAKLVKIYKRIR